MRRSAIVTSAAFMLATLTTGVSAQTGVASCDDFLKKYEACLASKVPAGDLPDPIRSDQEGLVGPRQEPKHQGRARRRLQADERPDEGGDDGLRMHVLIAGNHAME
jgi:hypothetical protein